MKTQVLGLCRFSYPSHLDAFQKSHKSLGALRRHLYDPARLETRFYFLEQVVLPTLRNQIDPDFAVVLLLGDQFPEPWRARLMAAIADIPQIAPVFVPEGQNHGDVCRALMLAARDPEADWVAEFRIDDDDGIARTFVSECRRLMPALSALALSSPEGRAVLDYAKGFVLAARPDSLDVHPVLARLWTPGMLTISRPGHPKSLLDAKHLRLWHKMPTLSIPDHPMFIRGAHTDNDSALQMRKIQGFRINPLDIPSCFEDSFGLDLVQLEARWMSGPAVLSRGG